jgi:hypothetical protein
LDYEQLDPGIVGTVKFLREAGVRTVSSCEGGDGHPYADPMVRFLGDVAEARRVVRLSRREGLIPFEIAKSWRLSGRGAAALNKIGQDLTGHWDIQFEPDSVVVADLERRHES